MTQSKLKDYYIPPRVLAFTIAAVVIGVVGLVSYFLVFGRITVTASVDAAYATLPTDPLERSLPHTYKLRPRRYVITVGANGYLDAQVPISVYPFVTQRKHVTLVRDYSYYTDRYSITYDYARASYVIAPHIALNVFSPPEVQLVAQWSDYEAKVNDAITYLKQQGADVTTLPITWGLQEWWPEGRSLDHLRSR